MEISRLQLLESINDNLIQLASTVKSRARASLTDACQILETISQHFLNALFPWQLENLNVIKPNYPAADLGDRKARIAIQITIQEGSDKITHTADLAQEHNLAKDYDRLIIFFLLPKKPSFPKTFNQPRNAPKIESWDIPDLLKQVREIKDLNILARAAQILEVELGKYQPPVTNPALHQLPPPPATFVGRETELHDLLSRAQIGNLAISGLRGMGGIGKTALALILAHQLKSQYPDAQFFLDLRGPTPNPLFPADALAHVIRSFGYTTKPTEKVDDLLPLYRSVLEGKRTLILLDNARDTAQVAPLVPPPGSLLLVTSRWQFILQGMHAVDLNKLAANEAESLLLQICPRIGNCAPALAQACDYLPLALRLAAASLAVRKSLKIDRYLKCLADTRTRLATLDKYQNQTPEERGITASLQLSVDLLDPELKTLWTQLAVFPATFDAQAAAAVWAMDPPEKNTEAAAEKLEDLHEYSLIDHTDGRWHLHDLARDFARSHLPSSDEAATRHARHYADVLAAAKELYLKGNDGIAAGLSLFDRDRHNIEAGQAWASAHATDDQESAALANEYPSARVYVLSLRLHPRQHIAWLEAALSAARFLKDRETEGAHLNNLGNVYADLGETRKAIEFYQQQLTIARDIGDRRGEGNALGNLGLAYSELGESRKAIEFHRQALAIRRQICDRRGEGNNLVNLGIAYANLGETHKAIEFHQQALAIYSQIGDRRGESIALGNLGIAYRKLGEPRQAIEFYQQQLTIARDIGDRRGEGIASFNMALAYSKLGQRDQAIPLAQHALAIYREIEDPYAPIVERTLAQWQSESH